MYKSVIFLGICLLATVPHVKGGETVSLPNVSSAFATPEQAELGRFLGKALFWDVQVGSGNGAQMACASCHYQAGADSHPARIEAGTMNPGDPGHSGSPNIIRGSLGVQSADFIAIAVSSNADGGEIGEACEEFTVTGDFFITGANAPSSINSDSIHNFWDGRANNTFNGFDISGVPTPLPSEDGTAIVQIDNASQASQAVGPVLSTVEMHANGRTFAEVGFKMCCVKPLAMQHGDIVDQLGPYGVPGGYVKLINDVFRDGPLEKFLGDVEVADDIRVCVDGNPTPEVRKAKRTECNFALFFGVAVAAYEQSLVTKPKKRPSKKQKRAFKEMRCDKCHFNDGRSHAVIGDVGNRPFEATGVEPLATGLGVTVEALHLGSPTPNDEADPNEGQFKSTHLFNLPLTAPYFHDGSAATLEDMLAFYVRGGDFNEDNRNSHVRRLDASKKEQKRVLKMLKNLTDPRIARGEYPFGHPSLSIPLGDGRTLELHPSGEGNGGLDYEIASP